MNDIAIYEQGSGGDLVLQNNDFKPIESLTTQVYLALFGGNTEQSTTSNLDGVEERFDWWGNSLLQKKSQFNSEFERIMKEVALNGAGLNQLVNAAKNDLKYLSDYAEISVEASIISLKRMQLSVDLRQPNNKSLKIKFIWDGQKNELIEQIII